MISIEKAQEDQFESCTREELARFADQLSIKHSKTTKSDDLRRMLCLALGITPNNERGQSPRVNVVNVRSKVDLFPQYNLGPEGIWGGRRHRVRLHKPQHATKNERAEPISWNGKKTFWVPYEEVVSLPEPIYNRLMELTRKEHRSVEQPDGSITTEWEHHEKFPMKYIGIDEATKDRAGSLQEWYQGKGPEWFKARTLRELQMIAQKLDIATFFTDGNKGRVYFDHNTMLSTMMTNIWGYPDVESAMGGDTPDEAGAAA